MASTEPLADPVVVDPEPFDFAGTTGHAALCLHGLTGTPYEVRSLGEALSAAGIRAFGPALPGHNATPEQLADVSYDEWLTAARVHLHDVRGASERIFLVGLSMGGLLSLALAAETPVDAIVVVGTPLRLHHPMAWSIPLFKYFQPLPKKSGGSDIQDDAARARHPSYDVMPMASVHELMRLQRIVRRGLPRIEAPILVAHGDHDTTAKPSDAHDILAGVSSHTKQHRAYARSGHVVPVDFDAADLARDVVEFLARHT